MIKFLIQGICERTYFTRPLYSDTSANEWPC